MEFSRPYRVLRSKSLRYIFATQADVKPKLTINFRVAILTEDFSVRSYLSSEQDIDR